MPDTYTYTETRKNLARIFSTVENDRTYTVVTRKGHQNVVIIAEAELNSVIETAHLFSSSANAKRLLESIIESDEHQEPTTLEVLKKEYKLDE